MHGELCFMSTISAVHTHAAAAAAGAIAGDFAAIHGERGAVSYIHAAAVGAVSVAGDLAAVHDELGAI